MKFNPRVTRPHARVALAALLLLLPLLLAAPAPAAAQTETHEPYALPAEWTAVRVWSSGGRSFARVNIQFPDGCFAVAGVGPVVRQGQELSVDFAVTRWTGGCTLAIVNKEYFFDLGELAPGATYTFTVRSRGAAVRSVSFDPAQVAERWEETSLERDRVAFAVWTAGGVTFASVGLGFPDDGHRVVAWEAPAREGSDFVSRVRLERWTGRATTTERGGKTLLFVLGQLPPGETFTVSVEFSDGVRRAGAPFTPAGAARPASWLPTDDPAFFVRQHYLDFLGREPDPEGLTFWHHDLVSNCPFVPSPCMDARRVHVSAAFFLSIEFQRTGYFVYRLNKAAYGTAPRFGAFMADTRRAAGGVVVGRDGWQGLLEENQRRFAEEFVARAEFRERYPDAMMPEQYVEALDRMIAHAWGELEGGPAGEAERGRLAEGLRDGTETRASVLARLAGHEQFARREFNRAFVLMQYFGYLRRDPDAAGYDFWLSKLDEFGGDYVAAEMVRAFLSSDEHRARFKP